MYAECVEFSFFLRCRSFSVKPCFEYLKAWKARHGTPPLNHSSTSCQWSERCSRSSFMRWLAHHFLVGGLFFFISVGVFVPERLILETETFSQASLWKCSVFSGLWGALCGSQNHPSSSGCWDCKVFTCHHVFLSPEKFHVLNVEKGHCLLIFNE